MENSNRISITNVITDLRTGGAEMMLLKLATSLSDRDFDVRVISLEPADNLVEKFHALGIPVQFLDMRRDLGDLFRFVRLIFWLREHKADLVQTWMYHGDLIGGLAAKLAGKSPIVWNIRHSNFGENGNRTTLLIRQISARVSSWLPTKIITNSETARDIHVELGYQNEKMCVIPNGFDLETFRPDNAVRAAFFRKLNLENNAIIIGLIARYHPQKDHRTFIKAAGLLANKYPDAHFVLVGERVNFENIQLASWIEDTGHKDRFHLLGRREDIPQITASLDIATSSAAHGEAFPNIIGEAMACQVPCVVTDVGDSAKIIGNTGLVVPLGDPRALNDAWDQILSQSLEKRRQLGESARDRIKRYYSLPGVVKQYEQLYRELM